LSPPVLFRGELLLETLYLRQAVGEAPMKLHAHGSALLKGLAQTLHARTLREILRLSRFPGGTQLNRLTSSGAALLTGFQGNDAFIGNALYESLLKMILSRRLGRSPHCIRQGENTGNEGRKNPKLHDIHLKTDAVLSKLLIECQRSF